MADVLIVCVREDEAQAKSLADMFEAAGFSVGGAPSSDVALRSSGVGVVVWSQASIRSRPFLDAAQRVINAGKGVLACLIEAPPPESVNHSPAFDLTGWNSDANDPSLDPLFFAVDRMVNTARASVGAAPAAYERPAARSAQPASAPSYSRARTAPPEDDGPQIALPAGFQIRSNPPPRARQPAPAPANEDLLGDEAEHWRAIRHSKDPTDFLDYLARYGPEGAFSELAEFRLKQLEGAGGQSSLRDAARAASEPARNYEPPPRRRSEPARAYEAPPPRRPDPPPRRPDPPPAPRAREREREPAPSYDRERDYRPPIDTRDVPKREGGFLRMLVLLVLLGGGAVAAGVYFGVGDRLQALTAPASTQNQTTPPVTEPASAPTNDQTSASPSDIPLAQVVNEVSASPPPAAAPRQRPVEVASNSRSTAARNASDDRLNAAATPQTSWGAPNTGSISQSNNSGPVSLLPGQQPSQQQTASFSPPPSVATTITPSGPAPAVLWAQRPSAERLTATYPRNALRDGTAGSAALDCVVRADFGVTCAVASERPAGAGFGRAALNAVAYYRSRPTLSDGTTAVGAHTHLTISFRAPQQ